MTEPKLYVAGNWKMNGLQADLREIELIRDGITSTGPDVAIFPPATLLHQAASLAKGSRVEIGAQDCHAQPKGAFTGDLSAPILKDAGATAVIVGHSERRAGHGETSSDVHTKALAVLKAGLKAVICIGETKDERVAGLAAEVCARQLAGSVPAESTPDTVIVAYEPVWAIGTGLSPTIPDITAIHEVVRSELHKRFPESAGKRWRVLYGGFRHSRERRIDLRERRGRRRSRRRRQFDRGFFPCDHRRRQGSLGAAFVRKIWAQLNITPSAPSPFPVISFCSICACLKRSCSSLGLRRRIPLGQERLCKTRPGVAEFEGARCG